MDVLYDAFDIPSYQEIIEQQKEKKYYGVLESGSKPDKIQTPEDTQESAQTGRFYTEECADTDLYGLDTDFQPVNTTVEMN